MHIKKFNTLHVSTVLKQGHMLWYSPSIIGAGMPVSKLNQPNFLGSYHK